ncbi:uncharacterized protein BO87DRAFT_3252 [Aspergillus neoniger CBS 115656]|uniref:Uncharacterized protein n=1 Tax=Aspergillus neoniger (strain CBS 115656) TaxID=1448310 RepID=A0A318YXE9_ASPNB|nr:hypothetical protein BO87DRAFT_3252 [Aspergillus neoniger CBS 115656]PYH39595.1 hypothetical protein BO87DRAFT_3252 [Aspergillus neoniger CBS 115656]
MRINYPPPMHHVTCTLTFVCRVSLTLRNGVGGGEGNVGMHLLIYSSSSLVHSYCIWLAVYGLDQFLSAIYVCCILVSLPPPFFRMWMGGYYAYRLLQYNLHEAGTG